LNDIKALKQEDEFLKNEQKVLLQLNSKEEDIYQFHLNHVRREYEVEKEFLLSMALFCKEQRRVLKISK